jgi:hypothetical protein
MDTLIFHRIGICVHQRFIRLHHIGLRRTGSKNKPNFVFHRRERRARREIFNIFLYALCLLALVARYVSNNDKKYQKRSKMRKNYQKLRKSMPKITILAFTRGSFVSTANDDAERI